MDWPKVEGRYIIGNKKSCIAVCTNASIDEINLDMDKIAIMGKCVTENIGMEKIIENIVTNPNIRFLILCGKSSKGHFVHQAFTALKENGVDKDKKIIGAIGNMPYLKNLDNEIIEQFRSQIILIDIVNITDKEKIMGKVDECIKKNPGVYDGKIVEIKKIETIEAERHKNFIEDPNGHFLVNVDKDRKKIIVEHYKDGALNKRIIGNNNEEVRDTIAKLKLIKDFERAIEHAIYIGRELYKAELALKHNLNYEQDSDLNVDEINKNNKDADYEWYD